MTLQRSWQVLNPQGRIVTIAGSGTAATDEQTQQAVFFVEPDQAQLMKIAELIGTKDLRPIVNTVVPFDQAGLPCSGQSISHAEIGRIIIGMN